MEIKLKENDRIRLIKMKPDPTEKDPIPPNTLGTVKQVQYLQMWNQTIVSMEWDNGRTLNILLPDDEIEIISST